jgi:hypothetical protein
MKNTWLLAVVAWLVLSAAACKKENKAEQLAALDGAYQAGVLSKEEYDAKRLALMGPPPAAPVTPAPAANPTAPAANSTAPPQNPPAAAPPAPAVEASPPAAPPPTAPERPKPMPRKPAAVVTQSRAIPPERTQAPPATAQPVPATPPPARAIPAPQPAATGEAEPQPLAGCVDTEYDSSTVTGARQRFYAAPLNAVVAAARTALRSLDFNIHKDTGTGMEASKQRHLSAVVGAGGERLILHFEKSRQGDRPGTLVTGETKKNFVGRVTQKSWTNAILAQIACHLAARR